LFAAFVALIVGLIVVIGGYVGLRDFIYGLAPDRPATNPSATVELP
jgi:hypothetical protein